MTDNNYSKKRHKTINCMNCGEALYDGDTAYRLGNQTYCPACVESALVICRDECAPSYTHSFLRKNTIIADIPHCEIILKKQE